MALIGSRAAEEAAHEIHVEKMRQRRLVRLGDRRHGKAAGNVDRRPEIGNAVVEATQRRLVGQLDRP